MLAVVGVVSFFVHLFSIGYMHGDRRYHIFFANISLFTFAMLGLVLADNLLFLFVFWELMGLMSYLLIGHFAHDQESASSSGPPGLQEGLHDHARRRRRACSSGIMMFFYHFDTLRVHRAVAPGARGSGAQRRACSRPG